MEYPWDQEANDMVMTPEGNYLITGYRDTTSYNKDSEPGVFLLEISPAGQVITDTLYYNGTDDKLYGHSIRPAPGGGYIIAGKIREEDAGRDDIMMISLKKDEHGKYNNIGLNLIQVNKVNEEATTGYATWVRPFEDGYLLAGQCRDDGDQMFLQKVDNQRFPEWTYYYGNNAWFSDGVIMGDTIYLAGYMAAPVDGSAYDINQAYIVKIDHEGTVIWERTYGGNRTVYSMAIDALVDGNLMIAAMPMSTPGNAEIALLKVDAVTGDSLYMQSYGTFYSAGIWAACPTANFEYLAAGRASATASQDRRIYVMRFRSSSTEANLAVAKEDLHLAIATETPTKDVINMTAEKIFLYGICVKIDSLIHPKVSDLELSLEHDGTKVTLVNQALLLGENFIHTNFIDGAEARLTYAHAPYTGWFLPQEPLSPFLLHPPTGEWTLTVTDHGTGGIKATTGMLEGWSLNLLVESGAGVGIPTQEALANFGLEQIRPNPLNQETRISFRIPERGHVNLVVYNQLGQLVASLAHEDLPEGVHSRIWNPG